MARSSTRPTRRSRSSDGAVTGGDDAVELALDPAGSPTSSSARSPRSTGFIALRPVGRRPRRGAAAAHRAARGLAARRATTLTAFTGVQMPGRARRPLRRAQWHPSPLGVTVGRRSRRLALWAPTAQSVALLALDAGAARRRRASSTPRSTRPTARGRVDGRGRSGDEYRWSVDGLRADDRRDRDQLGDRPVLGRAHDELDALGRRRPRRPGAARPSSGQRRRRPSSSARSTGRSTSCTCATSRSATRPCPRRSAAPTAPSPRDSAGTRPAASSSPTPASTRCTCCRRSTSPRSRRTGPPQATPAATSRRSGRPRPSSRRASSAVRDLDGFNWGYDPFHFQAPEGSYAVDPNGGARVGEFREMVGALHAHGPAGRARRGLQPHRRSRARARSRCSTGSCPATTSA